MRAVELGVFHQQHKVRTLVRGNGTESPSSLGNAVVPQEFDVKVEKPEQSEGDVSDSNSAHPTPTSSEKSADAAVIGRLAMEEDDGEECSTEAGISPAFLYVHNPSTSLITLCWKVLPHLSVASSLFMCRG